MSEFRTSLALLCALAGCDVAPSLGSTDQAETTLGPVSPLTGSPDSASTAWSPSSGAVLMHGRWNVPLVLPAGQPMPAVSAIVRDNTGTCQTCLDGDSVAMVLISSVAGQLAQVVSAGSAGSPPSNGLAGTGPTQTLTIPASTRIIAPAELFMLQFQTLGLWNNPSTARDMIGMVTVTPALTQTSAPFGASWRLQWNGGSPIVTTHSIQAPPGVQIGLVALGLRGAAEVHVVAPALVSGTVVMTASHGTGQDFTDRFSIGLQSPLGSGGTGDPVIAATSADVAAAASATPAVALAVGAKELRGRIISRFVTNTGASNATDASLEDAVIRVVGTLAY